MKLKSSVKVLGAGLAMVFAGSVGATTINNGLQPGFNTIEDQDRETFFDVDGDGTFSVGDVLAGWIRFDNFLPASGAGTGTDNQVYAVVSTQVIGVSGDGDILFGATTAPGLTLQALTGDANATGGMAAVYDGNYAADLVTTSAPGAVSIQDDVQYVVSNGTLRIVAGINDASDFFTATNAPFAQIGQSTANFSALQTSITVGSYTGGLSVLYNNTKWTFNDTITTFDAADNAFKVNQVGIGNGAIRGFVGDSQAGVFANGAPYGYDQCIDPSTGGNTPCGFVTDADFFVDVSVPVPGTLGLFGAALIGLGVLRRRPQVA